MSYLLRVDQSWPSPGSTEIGVRDGVLVPPESLDDPEPLEFEGSEVIATPGWINAHAHLELSGVNEIEYDGDFVDWIYDVMSYKESASEDEIRDNYRDATEELLASGVTRIVDHCDRTDLVLEMLDELRPTVHLLKELIAFDSEQIQTLQSDAEDFLEELDNRGFTGGLAPHAPYSAHPDIYRWASERVGRNGLSLSTHLHEVLDELEFAQNDDGRFLSLLQDRTRADVKSPYGGSRPLPYLLENNYLSDACFGVHLNYTNEEDLRWLESSNIRPVFCPRSYTYFRHDTLPVTDWYERGIDFALGTDSRASNDSLDMLQELRRLNELNDSIDPETILEALTINPAEVLGVPGRGVLTWGTPADLAIFEVEGDDLADLARGRAEPLATVVNGNPVRL